MLIKNVLTLDEACVYLGYKKSYMYKLTSAGIIPYSKPNGKTIFFDKAKLEEWMLSNPSSILSDRQISASTYISTNRQLKNNRKPKKSTIDK
jgi:excisionase family DNA binding protein